MAVRPGKYGIEFAAKRNGTILWPLDFETYRGRWDSSYVSGQSPSEGMGAIHRAFPVIRGICVEVDTAERVVRIFDPYAPGEVDEAKWSALSKTLKGLPGGLGKTNWAPMEAKVIKNLTADQLKDWMYQCRHHADIGKAEPLTDRGYSSWPSQDEIAKMPGKNRVNFYSASHNGITEYKNDVPVPAGAAS
jgi:hypothetical protein